MGQTQNLRKRMLQHRKGFTKSLRGRGEYRLLYFETHKTRASAMKREKFLKSGKGRELRQILISQFPKKRLAQVLREDCL